MTAEDRIAMRAVGHVRGGRAEPEDDRYGKRNPRAGLGQGDHAGILVI